MGKGRCWFIFVFFARKVRSNKIYLRFSLTNFDRHSSGDKIPVIDSSPRTFNSNRPRHLLVLGTSLSTFSSYRLVALAHEMKIPISLCTIGPTRADHLADIRLSERLTTFLPRLSAALSLSPDPTVSEEWRNSSIYISNDTHLFHFTPQHLYTRRRLTLYSTYTISHSSPSVKAFHRPRTTEQKYFRILGRNSLF